MRQAPSPPPPTPLLVCGPQRPACANLSGLPPGLLRASIRIRIDPLLQDRGGLEHHHATWRDRHFLAGLRVAADALPLLAHHERAERRKLYGLAPLEAIRD